MQRGRKSKIWKRYEEITLIGRWSETSTAKSYIDTVFAILPETIAAEKRLQPRTLEALDNILASSEYRYKLRFCPAFGVIHSKMYPGRRNNRRRSGQVQRLDLRELTKEK